MKWTLISRDRNEKGNKKVTVKFQRQHKSPVTIISYRALPIAVPTGFEPVFSL